MPNANKNQKDNFDKLLTDALKQYRLPVQTDFPQRMLSRLEQFEQAEALKKVVRQEQMLWVTFIVLPITAIALGLISPNILLVPMQWYETMYLLAKETAANMVQQWQLWLYYIGAALAAVYAVYDILLADN